MKKRIVLTQSSCSEIENIRLALELFTNMRVIIKQLDLNTSKGQVYVGDEIKDITYFFHENMPRFQLHFDSNQLEAFFDEDLRRIYVISKSKPVLKEGWPQWTVGTSLDNKWEEDAFVRENGQYDKPKNIAGRIL